MIPKSTSKSTKTDPKNYPESKTGFVSNCDRICALQTYIKNISKCDRKIAPKWTPNPPKIDDKSIPGPPWAQKCAKDGPGAPPDPHLDDVGTIFARFWNDLATILERFGDDFGTNLECFFVEFGIISIQNPQLRIEPATAKSTTQTQTSRIQNSRF